MASKLYKAVDKKDGELSAWIVNNRGVAVKLWTRSDNWQINSSMNNELLYLYYDIERFNDAVDPVLIAEWQCK